MVIIVGTLFGVGVTVVVVSMSLFNCVANSKVIDASLLEAGFDYLIDCQHISQMLIPV